MGVTARYTVLAFTILLALCMVAIYLHRKRELDHFKHEWNELAARAKAGDEVAKNQLLTLSRLEILEKETGGKWIVGPYTGYLDSEVV